MGTAKTKKKISPHLQTKKRELEEKKELTKISFVITESDLLLQRCKGKPRLKRPNTDLELLGVP